jgi:hypothetical protein
MLNARAPNAFAAADSSTTLEDGFTPAPVQLDGKLGDANESGTTIGTMSYMSSEQATGDQESVYESSAAEDRQRQI